MDTIESLFGISGTGLALRDMADPQTPTPRPYASTEATIEPPDSWRALVDPKGSAIFWIGAAAILGLVIVTGQFKVQAAFGSRVGRGRG